MSEREFEKLKGDLDNVQFGSESAAVIDLVRKNCEEYLATVVAEFKEVISRAEKLGLCEQAKMSVQDASDRLLQLIETAKCRITEEKKQLNSSTFEKIPLEFRSLHWSVRLEHIRAVSSVSEARGRTELEQFLRSVVGISFTEYEDYQRLCKELRATTKCCAAVIVYDGHPCTVSSIHPKRTNGMFRFSEGSIVWCSITKFPECSLRAKDF